MKIFIWKNITGLTNHYHSDGGLVIMAENIEEAQSMIALRRDINLIIILPSPDYSFDINSGEKEVIVFPNAGCC